jgi:hypothetical protein
VHHLAPFPVHLQRLAQVAPQAVVQARRLVVVLARHRAAHRVLLPAPDLVRRLVPNPATYRAPVRVRHLALDRAARLVLRPVLRLA